MGILLLFWATLVWYEDKLLRFAVESLNENIKAELNYSQTSTAPFRHFPHISVALSHLSLRKKQSTDTLIYAQSLYFTFDLFEIWRGKTRIAQIYAENGFIRAKANAKGVWNWEILKKTKTEKDDQDKSKKAFQLDLIQLKNIKIQFTNLQNAQQIEALTPSTALRFSYSEKETQIKTQSEFDIPTLKIGNYAFYTPQKIKLDLDFRKNSQVLSLRKTNLQIGSAEYAAAGSYHLDTQTIDFQVNSEKGTLTDLFRLLPQQLSTNWEKYRSEGKIFFELKAKGTMQQPDLELHFGAKESTFYYPDLDRQIDSLSLEGFWEKNQKGNQLIIKHIAGKTEKSRFAGKGTYQTVSPQIQLNLNAEIDLAELRSWLPEKGQEKWKMAKGKLNLQLDHESNLADYQNFTKTKGSIRLTDWESEIQDFPTIRSGKAEAIFENTELRINHFSAYLGNSQTRLQGELRNWQSIFRQNFENIETDFSWYFSKIDLADFLKEKKENSEKNTDSKTAFVFGKHHLFLQIDTLIYKDLAIQKFNSQTHFTPHYFRWENTNWEGAKGKWQSNGKLDFSDTSRIETRVDMLVKNVDLSSFLKQVESIKSVPIKAEQLGGLLNFDLQADMILDQNFDLQKPSLEAEIGVRIQNGTLQNYAPLRKMGEWLKDRDWENVRFGDLENRFLIDSQQVIVPKMEVRTSAGVLFLWGTQGFDPVAFDYHLQIPLRNLSAPPESLEPNSRGGSNVFLKVQGTPEKFEIKFDKVETVQKIKDDLKRKWERFKAWFRK